MEEYRFTWFDPVISEDYRTASSAHSMAVSDFQRASDGFPWVAPRPGEEGFPKYALGEIENVEEE